MFADQVHGDVLRVVTGERDASINRLLESDGTRARFAALDEAALLGAYRLRVFRNKLVTHPPDTLTGASVSRIVDHAATRLWPLRWGQDLPDGSIEVVHALARRAELTVPGVAEELSGTGNLWELLQLLFDGVPPLDGDGRRSELRAEVDRLVGKLGGVRSPTMAEVIETMTLFLTALAVLVDRENRLSIQVTVT